MGKEGRGNKCAREKLKAVRVYTCEGC